MNESHIDMIDRFDTREDFYLRLLINALLLLLIFCVFNYQTLFKDLVYLEEYIIFRRITVNFNITSNLL